MKQSGKRIAAAMLAALLLCLCCAALAERVDMLEADAGYYEPVVLSGDGICVTLSSAEGDVRVTVTNSRGNPVFDKVYGSVSGSFASETLYMPSGGAYTLRVTAGGAAYQVDFQVQRGMEPLPTEYGWIDGGF